MPHGHLQIARLEGGLMAACRRGSYVLSMTLVLYLINLLPQGQSWRHLPKYNTR